jgi:hypothetical protein
MKTLLLVLLLIPTVLLAQPKGYVVLSAARDCAVEIDGDSSKMLLANRAMKIEISPGDHLIQASFANGMITRKVTVVAGSSLVVILEQTATDPDQHAVTNAPGLLSVTLTDHHISLAGGLSDNPSGSIVYCLDQGDQIDVELTIDNKKGSLNFALLNYENGQVLFSSAGFRDFKKSLIIPRRGIYIFRFTTNHLFDRSAHLRIERSVKKESGLQFNVNPIVVHDTTYTTVMDRVVRVYSATNLEHSNRTVVPIQLPVNTSYWTFWLGVDAQSESEWATFARKAAGALGGVNPMYALGLNLVSELPVWRATGTVNYNFMDHTNASLFLNGLKFNYYTLKSGSNVSSDFAQITATPGQLNLCLSNLSSFTGRDVHLKIAAFKVSALYEIPDQQQ